MHHLTFINYGIMFTELCNHHKNPVTEQFYYKSIKIYKSKYKFDFINLKIFIYKNIDQAHLQLIVTPITSQPFNLLLVSIDLPFLNILYKLNWTVYSVLRLFFFFMEHN